TVTVRDSAGNSADAVTAAVAVAYEATLLSPPEGRTVSVPRGATVPVAVLVRDCDGSVPGGLTAPTVIVTLGDRKISEATLQRLGPLWAGLVRTRSFPAEAGPYTVTVTVPDTGQSVTSTVRLRR
ncbi:MAG: hypothetical protein ACRCY8_16710, partial [Dermatophilaceae bacterium]